MLQFGKLVVLGLFVLFVAIAVSACESAEVKKSEPGHNVNAATSQTTASVSSNDLTPLKRFAESYEPTSGRDVVPSPPELDPQLSELIAQTAKSGSRAHKPYIVLIFLKLGRFHVENFNQSYELGRYNPLTKEFYRLIGENDYERAELMSSHLANNYVKKHPELLEYVPIKIEMQRIEKAGEKIKREAQLN